MELQPAKSALGQRRRTVALRWVSKLSLPIAVMLPCLALAGCFDEESVLPTIATVQAAYDSAKLEEADHHDDQLLIQDADCHPLDQAKFTCQVGFTDRRSTNGRLYFDVIGLDRINRTWRLVSGLCRR